MSERITGKVARVTSDREVILNRGSADGVERGTYFFVKGEPVEVKDPDSGETLGSVTPIKVVVQAQEVSERFCIARTFRTRRIKISDAVEGGELYTAVTRGVMAGGLGRQLQPPQPAKYETKVETLRLDPRKGEPISSGDSIVEVGDVVESALKGEDINPITTTLFR